MESKLSYLFWIVWVLTLGLSLIEAFTYYGFIDKHIGFNYYSLIYITVILGVILLILRHFNKHANSKKADLYLHFFIVLSVIFAVLKVTNRVTHPNFVFSLLHLQPNNLFPSLLISMIPLAVIYVPKMKYMNLFNKHKLILLFTLSVIILNIYKIYKNENWAIRFIINNPRATYDDKMRRTVGSKFYNYSQFINNNTPSDSMILIPPQAFPWPQSGNGAFMRYFMYPRKLGNGDEFVPGEQVNIDDYDYVLLDWGETDTVEDTYTHGWPKFDISAEEILLMNEDGTLSKIISGDYIYEEYKDQKVWGLIKVKH